MVRNWVESHTRSQRGNSSHIGVAVVALVIVADRSNLLLAFGLFGIGELLQTGISKGAVSDGRRLLR